MEAIQESIDAENLVLAKVLQGLEKQNAKIDSPEVINQTREMALVESIAYTKKLTELGLDGKLSQKAKRQHHVIASTLYEPCCSVTDKFSADWVDKQFTYPSRYKVVPKLQEALDVLAGMGKVIRGTSNANQKLAEAKYRQKDSSKEAAKGRRKVSLDTSKEMRKAQKWIKDNPGKEFSDYLSFQETEIKVND